MIVDGLARTVNPTACLPALRSRPGAVELYKALCHLADLYSPPSLKGTDRALWMQMYDKQNDVLSGDLQDALDAARIDQTEKRFAMSWITGLIGSGVYWIQESDGEFLELTADNLLDLAGRVLGGHAAIEEAGSISREFAFPLSVPVQISESLSTPALAMTPGSLKITLRDDALPPSTNDDNGETDESGKAAAAVGVQTWGAAVLMSDILTCHPGLFHTNLATSSDVQADREFRVLELGAGTGLVGMVTARLLQQLQVSSEIVLSDYHDQVLDNLRYNLEQNFPETSVSPRAKQLDWYQIYLESIQERPVERKRYDLLLLADVIYAPDHAAWIHSSVQALLKRPNVIDDQNEARAHIIMAVRTSGKFEGLFRTVEAAFGERCCNSTLPSLLSSHSATPHETMPGTPSLALSATRFKDDSQHRHSSLLHSRITALNLQDVQPHLCILKKRWLEKRPGIGRHDEQGYLWFEIGWAF